MPHEVFISYSSKDYPVATQVCASLEGEGIPCWMAPRDISPGKEWLQAIMEAIGTSHVLLLIVSAHAIDSPQVQRELVCAVNQRVPVLPFRIEPVTFTPAFEYLLCVPQWLDAEAPPLQRHLPRLVEAVRQLLPAGGPAATQPSPNAPSARPSHNLPAPATPLIGREQELTQLCDWLAQKEIRLVTLTGPGGTGKTRLSLEVGATLLERFVDGVFLIPLAPVRDAELFASTIAQTLEVPEAGGRRLLDALREYLADREMLLILDNFEQVMQAAASVTELLAGCPRLKLLISSREALHVRGEREYPVPPLALPALKQLPPVDELGTFAAIALFCERAAAARPDFTLTAENGAAVAEICVQLDGLPLAIELAAARIKLLPPAAMLARLENRLKLLTTGARDLPERQRTLRGAIDWSYDLLEEEEKTLFRWLSVFVGGFTLEAAEAVCPVDAGLAIDLLDGTESLVNKSLVRQEAPHRESEEPRFGMMATIREYALECLAQSGDEAAVRERHACFFLELAETADRFLEFYEYFEADESGVPATQATLWLDRLEREHDNFRAVLTWCETPDRLEVGLRLAGALGWFWGNRGYWSEGRSRLATLLARAEARTKARAKALHAAGWLAWRQGEYAAAQSFEEEALAIRQELGDAQALGQSLDSLGLIARTRGDCETARSMYEASLALQRSQNRSRGVAVSLYHLSFVAKLQDRADEARSLAGESLEIWRKLGDKGGIAAVLDLLGDLAWREGDAPGARALFEESLRLRLALGNPHGVALSRFALGEVARLQGDYAAAQSQLEESLKLWRSENDLHLAAVAGEELARVKRDQGDYAAAAAQLEDSLTLRREVGDRHGIASCLQGLATVASAAGRWADAAGLFGAASEARQALGLPVLPADPDQRADVERHWGSARAGLGDEAFEQAYALGRSMTIDQAVTNLLNAPY